MFSYLLAILLVGLPALYGAYLTARKIGRGDASTGLLLVAYAFVLGGMFYRFLPQGKLLNSGNGIEMPGVFLISVVIGVIVGYRKRKD